MPIIRAGILISGNIYSDDFTMEENVAKNLIDGYQYMLSIENYTDSIHNNNYCAYEV